MMPRIILAMFLTVCAASLALSQSSSPQTYPKIEVFAGYLYSHDSPYSVFDFGQGIEVESSFATHHGLEASVIRNVKKYLGFKADFSAHFHHDAFTVNACLSPCINAPTVKQAAELNPRLFNLLAGPELKKRNHTKLTPFTHALFGLAFARTTFKTSGTAFTLIAERSEKGFAMAFGGGVDIRMTGRFSLRASGDYNPAWVGRDDDGARQRQNDIRVSLGLLFRH